MSVLKVQSMTHFPERQVGYALLFGSRGFSVGVCCSRTRGTRDSYFWYAVAIPCSLLTEMCIIYRTPGVGYTRWHISFPIAMLQLVSFSIDYHWACNHIGIADLQ
ncbi:hypothetical protein V8E53_009184 [Lactarius tabidus]